MPIYPTGQRLGNMIPLQLTNAGFAPVLGPSEKRVAITFGGTPASAVQFTTEKSAPGHSSINIPPQAGPITLTYEEIGDLVKKAWYGQSDVAGPLGALIIECLDNS